MNEHITLWLNRQIIENPMYRIVCFPHAGGAASFFKNWSTSLPNFEVCAVRYPGRAERIEEPQPTDLHEVAWEIAKAIETLSDLPLILFGHSMGAVVALETVRMLESKHIEVIHLFDSGSRNGPLPKKGKYIEEDDETLCKHLVEMGGTDPEAANDPMFLELILPSIRADGKLFNEYNMILSSRLKCPVTTIFGDVDDHADIRPWQDITSREFNEFRVAGDHFYLISEPPNNIIKNSIERCANSKIRVA